MRKKYNYFVNNIQVTRKDFFIQLRACSQKVIRTDVIAGWCGVDLMGLDEKKYKGYVRDINEGFTIIVVNGKASKKFQRKEV